MDGNAKRSFTIALKKDPKTPCTCNGCPFGICTDYLALCPLPFGEEESSGNKSLFFMRSKTSRGFIKFTKGRVGESTMRGINNDLNEILPEELRMKRVTAHSGRHTGIQCSVVVAKRRIIEIRKLSLVTHMRAHLRSRLQERRLEEQCLIMKKTKLMRTMKRTNP